jgi:hypothetical protein
MNKGQPSSNEDRSIWGIHTFALHITRPILGKVVQEAPVSHESDILLWAAVNPVAHLSSPFVNGRQFGSVNSPLLE